MPKKTNDEQSIYSDTNVDDMYKKLKHVEHVLALPDTYVASVEPQENRLHVIKEPEHDGETLQIVKEDITWTPGLLNIFTEILVNATDHYTRIEGLKKKKKTLQSVTEIDVTINQETNTITIRNNGEGIDAKLIEEHQKYPVQLIFCQLLTSTNYNKEEEKTIGGKNGYGAKLTNIFSTYFKVTSVDRIRKKRVTVECHNNMSEENLSVETYKKSPYTEITFTPDLPRFSMKTLTDDMVLLMKKRVYDSASWCPDISFTLNGTPIHIENFKDYARLYLSPETPIVYYKCSRWEVVATVNKDEIFEQITFVNGINTIRGGRHVNYIVDQIKKTMIEILQKKHKLKIRPQSVTDQLQIFIKATIVNPAFDSQTKETLTTTVKKFGSTCKLPKTFFDKLTKQTNIIERIISQTEYKNNKSLCKTDGTKKCRIKIPKLDDANWAGGKKSKQCTLILTEGDSAKTTAISGLSVVGRDAWGVFPLRGKIINVKNARAEQVAKNKEIINLKKILGLKNNMKYDFSSGSYPLRYGKVMIMTDQDVDGSHIKGLLMNVFNVMWPELLQQQFIVSLVTPIVKVTKKSKSKSKSNAISFYNLSDYDAWKTDNNGGKGWKIKYYKGLGTSTSKEAKEYFKNMNITTYQWEDEEEQSFKSIELAFNKDNADARKQWLGTYQKDQILDASQKDVTYSEFIDLELKHFSMDDLKRSIPSLVDGCKPSQRKVLYSCFKRNLTSEVKVAQLSGYVGEHSAYHHGEMSLQSTIISLAQRFPGSNNLNLLEPNGQFGTRLMGGKDSASPRYIFTQLNPLTMIMFPKHDRPLLNYLHDDGFSIEPEYYVPILPTVLINGAKGIGTGYSTEVPNYNPLELKQLILQMLDGHSIDDYKLKPFYRWFTGKIIKKEKGNGFWTKGIYKIKNANTLIIKELPVGCWTEQYKDFLDSCLIDSKQQSITIRSKKFLKSYRNHSTEDKVLFELKFPTIILNSMLHAANYEANVTFLEKKLNLITSKSVSNMHLYNEHNRIQKFSSPIEIIKAFYSIRFSLYTQRKEYMINHLQKIVDLLNARVQFIMDFIESKIELRNKSKVEIKDQFKTLKYPKLSTGTSPKNYDYLLNMSIYSLTKEKVDELKLEQEQRLNELMVLKHKTEQDMWRQDLHDFETLLKRQIRQDKKMRD